MDALCVQVLTRAGDDVAVPCVPDLHGPLPEISVYNLPSALKCFRLKSIIENTITLKKIYSLTVNI